VRGQTLPLPIVGAFRPVTAVLDGRLTLPRARGVTHGGVSIARWAQRPRRPTAGRARQSRRVRDRVGGILRSILDREFVRARDQIALGDDGRKIHRGARCSVVYAFDDLARGAEGGGELAHA